MHKRKIVYVMSLFFFLLGPLFAQQKQPQTVNELVNDFAVYKGRPVTLQLRLKSVKTPPYGPHRPWVFVFYDSNNVDIIFTLDSKEQKQKFAKIVPDLRPGIRYYVSFTTNKVENGELSSILHDIRVVFLDELL